MDGAQQGWTAACDEFFNSYVGSELFWGDDIVWMSQADCDLANAYQQMVDSPQTVVPLLPHPLSSADA